MSDQYETSYYEIALTGRQVLVAFVILLVCVFAAFFSGVWVGRGDAAPAGRVMADLEPLEETAEATDADGEPIEQLSFFEDRRPTEEQAPQAADPPDRRAEAAQEEPRRDPEPRSAPAETPPARQQAEEESRPAPPEVVPAQPVERQPEMETESEPEPAPEAAPAAPTSDLSGGDVVVQVIVTGDEARARDVLEQLSRNRFRAFLSPVESDGRTLYRVRLGPFERLADAESVAARVKSELGFDTWITR